MLLGSIDSGGRRLTCAVADEHQQIIKKALYLTTDPAATFKHIVDFFSPYQEELAALGVASFGPIDIDPQSPTFGYITTTPKVGWKNVNFVGELKKHFNLPIYWTTGVNASVYGEYLNLKDQLHHGSLVYFTLGTGVGAGAIQNGNFIGGVGAPEMGHVFVKRHPDDRTFTGICPYHGDCLEGLVGGPTFQARLGIRGEDVDDTDHVWDILAYYVAQASIQATTILRPEKIIFGGNVARPQLIKKVREQFERMFNHYMEVGEIEDYIIHQSVPRNESATRGNFALAAELLK